MFVQKTKEEEAEEKEKLKQEKERLKQEQLLAAIRAEEERKFNKREEKLRIEEECTASCRDMVKKIYDKLGYQIKWPLIQAKARHIWGYFEIVNEWKDLRTRLLEDDIKGRDVRTDLLRSIHIEVIHKLIKNHEMNMNTLLQDFESRKKKMLTNRYSFLQYALIKGNQLRDEIRISAYGVDKAVGEQIQKTLQKNALSLGTYKETCNRLFQEMYQDYEATIVEKWIKFKNIFEEYKKAALKLQMSVYVEKTKFEKDNELIRKFKREGRQCQKEIKTFTVKGSNEGPWDRRLDELVRERSALVSCLSYMTEEQKISNKNDNQNIEHLSEVSNDVINELKKLKELTDRILYIRNICYKYETEEEKIFSQDYKELPNRIHHEEMDCVQMLDKFIYRISQVKLQNDFISAKIKSKKEENESLKKRLKFVISYLLPQKDIDVIMQQLITE